MTTALTLPLFVKDRSHPKPQESRVDDDASLALIRALSTVWTTIRHRHPDVPGVVLLPAPALRRGVLGHFAPLRWSPRRQDGALLHEVVVVGEHLDRDPSDVVETLLHEAAHAMNFERGIRDCSASQYHNQKFQVAAEELGLLVAKVPHYGFALTAMTPLTTERYEEVTHELTEVLLHRRSFLVGVKTPTGGANGTSTTADATDDNTKGRNRKAVCACDPPFIIRASKKTLTDTTVRCDRCSEPFYLA